MQFVRVALALLLYNPPPRDALLPYTVQVVKIASECKRINVPDINWIGATLHFDNGSSCYVIGNWASGRRIFKVQMHAPGICADVELEKE